MQSIPHPQHDWQAVSMLTRPWRRVQTKITPIDSPQLISAIPLLS
jgi:hypothetical protein